MTLPKSWLTLPKLWLTLQKYYRRTECNFKTECLEAKQGMGSSLIKNPSHVLNELKAIHGGMLEAK
jgi:hypothetical protein